MCQRPGKLEDGTLVACRTCSICQANYRNDWVGRALAEQATATATFAVTLTYEGDRPEAAILNYSDVQLFLKRLRKAGHKVRYICAGEYGTLKGRAHWHIILFFYGKVPNVELGRRVHWEYWSEDDGNGGRKPLGYCFFQQAEYAGFKYLVKYAVKDQMSEGHEKRFTMSKAPAIGYEFFMRYVDDLVERALPFQSPEYSFAHVRDRKGKVRKFWLRDRMLELALQRYQETWEAKYGEDPPDTDTLVNKWYLRERYTASGEQVGLGMEHPRRVARRDKAREPYRAQGKYWSLTQDAWVKESPRGIAPFIAPEVIGYLTVAGRKPALVVAYTQEVAEIVIGEKEWLVGTIKGCVEQQLENSGLPRSSVKPVFRWLREKWQSQSGASHSPT